MLKPEPDLMIAFRVESLLSVFRQANLQIYRSVMYPESSKQVKRDGAFHFLSIEAKGASGEIENWTAHQQNFYTVTQALHNLYFFITLAGEEVVEHFYKKIRFFSVIVISKAFHVHVHRAIKTDEAEDQIMSDKFGLNSLKVSVELMELTV